MTARVLIVDDDLSQLRLLARLISMRRRDLTVLTATHGLEAIEVLESGPVEIVLTDLQMAEMNGFELIAWLTTHQPHVRAYAMTAYPDAQASNRLAKLRGIECFTKPLDVPVFLERITDALAAGARGHVQNIGLPSFVQLLAMERETCTLAIEASSGREGQLFMVDGELFDARTGSLEGSAAAVTILAWPSPAITILNTASARARTIREPVGFLIMEALRIEDEAQNAGLAPPTSLRPMLSLAPESPLDTALPPFVRAAAIIPLNADQLRATRGDWTGLETLPQAAIKLFEPHVEEIVLTGPRFWLVAQPIAGGAGGLAAVAFDTTCGSLLGARGVLRSIAAMREHLTQTSAALELGL